MSKLSTTRLKRVVRPLAVTFLLGATAACSMTTSPLKSEVETDTVSYHQERLTQATHLQDFAVCRDEGLEMERMARQSGNAGQYLISARVLEDCLVEADGRLERHQEMRVMALTIQNYAKGGDAVTARQRLRMFEERFPSHDLYYADGTSFSESMAMALGMLPLEAAGAFSTANVNDTLKAEMRRSHYWQHN